MIKHLLLTCLLCLTAGMVNAQTTMDKVPPSPTAASIIAVGEISTSKFTGTPNISVPIYQVAYHNMSVPISLSYNAQGIRVNDVPGWVGANWSLNAGGVITRMINGLADETVSSGYFTLHPGYESAGGITTTNQLREYDAGSMDGHPDIYSFSFPGGSGKFMIDHNKDIHVFPHQKLKVEFISISNNIDQGFKIITLDGTEYTFNETESTTVSASGPTPGGTYISAWYLKSITSPIFPGKQITFDYTSYINLSNTRKIKTYSATRRYYTGAFEGSSGTVTSEKNVNYNVKRLEKIDWGTGSVEFKADSARTDVSGDSTLNRVLIKDNLGSLVSEYRLTYGYYSGASGKLRLDKVQEYDESGNPNPAYEFTYDATGNLPDYNDTGQDYWGYYNGKSSNLDLLPRQTVDFSEVPSVGLPTITAHYNIGNADREPDETYLKYGILTGITYPTGGSTHFEYEANRYRSVIMDSLTLQSGLSCGSLPNLGTGFDNDYDYIINTFGRQQLNEGSTSAFASGGPEGASQTTTTTFTIPDAQKVKFEIDIDQYSATTSYVRLEKDVSGSWVQIFNQTTDGERVESLTTGTTYRLVAFAGGEGTLFSDEASIDASWYIATGNTTLLGPGLRIKQISQKESATSSAINIRKFEYKDDSGNSSGMLYAMPVHSYRKFMEDGTLLVPLIVQNTSSAFLDYGSPLGYSQVTEIMGTNGERGKVVDKYRVSHGDAYNQLLASDEYVPNQFPFAPSVHSLWDEGQLLESTVYRKKKTGESGADFKKVQQTVNTYAYQSGGTVKGVSLAPVTVAVTTGVGNSCYEEINYELMTLWEKLIKTEQTIFSNDEIGQTTVTDITYETTPKHLQVLSQSVTGSDGKKTITEYTYPEDYTTAHPYASGLIAKEMHAAVIEEISIREDGGTRQIIGAKITEYNSTAYQPKKIYTLKVGGTILESSFHKSKSYNGSNALLDSRYEERIAFDYEDGNLVEQVPKSGNALTYIWGYDGQFPVAQVQNATYNDIENLAAFGTNFDLGIGGLTTAQENALRGLKNTLITTMTYKIGEGMKSQKTPNGLTTTYEYDSFNRLKYVKDKDGNILRKMEYTYKVNANTTNN